MVKFTKSKFERLTLSLGALILSSCATQPEIASPKIDSLSQASPKAVAVSASDGSKTITILDRDAQPLLRVPPKIPTKAKTSGHCKMRFDVPPGNRFLEAPTNIEVLSCSKKLFRRNAIASVRRWRFTSAVVDGRYVGWKGVESTVRFNVKGPDGKLIPE